MNTRTKELLRRIFSLRNAIPLLIIIGAFIGTFVNSPFGIQRDQLLLALLAFLAIDALLERLEMLSNIERDVGRLKELAEAQKPNREILRYRKDFPRLEHLIADAQKEIWISGITLDTMVTLTGLFSSKLNQGFKLKFLALQPEEGIINEASDYFGTDVDELNGRLRANLSTLYKRLAQSNPSQVEIRMVNHLPGMGYFIIDPDLDQAYLTITPYLYRTHGNDTTPILLLYKKTESQWFDIYLNNFIALWNNASKLEVNP